MNTSSAADCVPPVVGVCVWLYVWKEQRMDS